MRREVKIGFLLALAVLILIGLLGMPIGAVLGIFLLLTTGAIGVFTSHVVSVRRCTALIVCSRQHDAVIRTVMGPATTFLQPLLEVTGAILDTDYRLAQVYLDDILLRDQHPTTFGFTVRVSYHLAPDLLTSDQLEELLSTLASRPRELICRETDYCLRKLAAAVDSSRIHTSGQSRLERCLHRLLADRLAQQGIRIRDLQLVIHSPTGLQETLNRAEQQRVISDVQVDSLAKVLGALAGKSDEARSLADLEFAQSLGRNGQLLVAVDRYSRRDDVWVDRGELLSADHEQVALWPRVLQKNLDS